MSPSVSTIRTNDYHGVRRSSRLPICDAEAARAPASMLRLARYCVSTAAKRSAPDRRAAWVVRDLVSFGGKGRFRA